MRTRPFWTFEWCHVGHEAVVSEDPFRVELDVDVDGGATLSVTLDRSGDVVETERPSTA